MKGRAGRQFSRATQTGNLGNSLDRPLPHVVVTAPSPDDRRPIPEPTLMRQARSSSGGSPGRVRPRLSATSNTPDSITPADDEYTPARSAPSDGDLDVVEGRQRLAQNGLTSSSADRVGNRDVVAADDDDDVRRRNEAEVHALLRELDIE